MINRAEDKQVKIIRLVSGEEICCKFPLHKNQLPENSKLLRLQEPMLIKYVPRITEQGISDYIALVKWVGFTNDKIITIPKDKIMTIVNANNDMSKSYNYMMTNYEKSEPLARKEKPAAFKRERLSDEDNDRVNEIFDEFEDDEFIPKKTLH